MDLSISTLKNAGAGEDGASEGKEVKKRVGSSDAPTASAGSSTSASVKSSILQTVQLNLNSVMKLGMKDKTWSEPKSMKFLLTIEKLDSGGFRDAFSMKCIQGEYRSK